ncbi:unnamed protein product [Prorocentrum cordatum]|uniref:Uncharacterized protein n=1 Tax=Prorocentrum cordatum TaxID=2364126 RepID=A0ABN9R8I3_9DINO|nr:unnamed protein product [Polarella glacialis]
MARAAARLLLGGCLGTLCWGCTEEQALVFNRLAGRDLLKLANAGIGNLSFETIGDCAAAGDGLKPCRSVPNFPVHMQGKDWKITVPYATGLDTFSMTNISLRCDPTSSATPAELGWFAELDGTIRDFGINVSVFGRSCTS